MKVDESAAELADSARARQAGLPSYGASSMPTCAFGQLATWGRDEKTEGRDPWICVVLSWQSSPSLFPTLLFGIRDAVSTGGGVAMKSRREGGERACKGWLACTLWILGPSHPDIKAVKAHSTWELTKQMEVLRHMQHILAQQYLGCTDDTVSLRIWGNDRSSNTFAEVPLEKSYGHEHRITLFFRTIIHQHDLCERPRQLLWQGAIWKSVNIARESST